MNKSDSVKIRFWARATVGIAVAVILFALAMMMPPRPAVAYFNYIIYGVTSYPSTTVGEGERYVTFVYGVLGAVIIGWLSLVLLLARVVGRTGSRSVASAMVGSTLIWFVVDTLFSLVMGYPANAISNIAFAAVLLFPMWNLQRSCTSP
jgi:hypothetical protein